jgi:hypothetical protein
MIGEVRCINYCKKDVHVDITFIAFDACLVVHRYNVDDHIYAIFYYLPSCVGCHFSEFFFLVKSHPIVERKIGT